MKSGFQIFLSSLIFGVAVSASYWFSSHEPAGAMLLGLMSIGFVLVSAYTALDARSSDLAADRQEPDAFAGERVGRFILESPWPLATAVGSASVLIGITLQAWLAPIGALIFACGVVMLIRESG